MSKATPTEGAATASETTVIAPAVTKDPRFRAGRTLVQTGRAGEGAIDMFATLLEESRSQHGDASIEAAACYYEYGNALFRATAAVVDAVEEEAEEAAANEPSSPEPAAIAATSSTATPQELGEKLEAKKDEKKPSKEEDNQGEQDMEETEAADEEEEGDDVNLALECMENTWSILDKYVQEDSKQSSDGSPSYHEWAVEQQPRVLLGIGDVLSALGRHADAADAYSRAIPYREAALEQIQKESNNNNLQLDHLKRRRHLVEANVLVAEALLACPAEEDVVTTETEEVLVKASERVDFARGYYDKARDELQEAVFLMGKIAASGQDLGSEKEDVCFLATMLMGVGTTLAELDEAQAEADADTKPAAKKQKTG